MILKLLRNGLGLIIVFINYITLPKQIKRSEEEQQLVQAEADKLALYQFFACPFCIKTRRAIHALNIDIDYRDVSGENAHRHELRKEGGEVKVPCLRIEKENEVYWMYESSDIIEYLHEAFGEK